MRYCFLSLCFICTWSNSALANTAEHYSVKAKRWYSSAEQRINNKAKKLELREQGKAKNIILFIGDGMGVSTITAARIFAGQQMGKAGEEHELAFDKFPYSGLARTYNTNQQTPDSAGTISAIMTGVKTKAGIINISQDAIRDNCASGQNHELLSALELAELAGKATGVVTTARVTHATPAGTFAHAANRSWEDNSDMPINAINEGCKDIAQQLVYFRENLQARFPKTKNINGLEIVLGGGRRHFLPNDAQFNSKDNASLIEGDRTDNRNLVAEWQTLYPHGKIAFSSRQLKSATSAPHVFGLFNESHMRYEANRNEDILGEPSLAEMTSTAIQHLKTNNKGFFLLVEAGRIDHAHHAGNAFNALNDVVALSAAVDAAVKQTNERDTLIIVTADHSHTFTMAGYPTRGNPILGKVIGNDKHGNPKTTPETDSNGNPYTTLGYINGMGYATNGSETDADKRYDQAINTGRKNLSKIDTTEPGYHQEALVPLSAETHGGEDVAIYAQGPGAALLSGSHEQHDIFHVMNYAGKLDQTVNRK